MAPEASPWESFKKRVRSWWQWSAGFRRGFWSFVRWSVLSFVVLFFAGLAARGLGALEAHQADPFWHGFLRALLTFAVGGGIAIGAAMLLWRPSGSRSNSWVVMLFVVGAALILIFIWPTPYKYYKAKDLSFFVKVNRLTGTVSYACKIPEACPQK